MSSSTKDYLIENVIGGAGEDYIAGGKANDTLGPGGGATDQLRDYGGYDGSSGYPAIPDSDDTYKGFSSNTGTDYGGAADVVDLKPFESTNVYVDTL